MSDRDPIGLDPEIEALLEAERGERPLPSEAQEQMLARLELATASEAPRSARPLRTWPSHALAAAAGAIVTLLAVRVLAPPHERLGEPIAPASSTTSAVEASPALPADSAPTDAVSRGVEISALPSVRAPAPSARPRLEAGATAEEHDDVLAIEARLVDTARAALARRDFAAALAAAERHAHGMPDGRLAEEREAIAVQALASAGRADEARARASAFRARWPSSFSRPLVDAAIRSIP